MDTRVVVLDENKKYVALDREDLKKFIPDENVRVERLAYGTFEKLDEGIDAFVDVALIQIDPKSNQSVKNISERAKKAFKQQSLQFHYSEIDDAVYPGDIVFHIGTSCQPTFGTIGENSHVNLLDAPGLINVVGALKDGERQPFSSNGDSGALVFKVDPCLLNDEVLSTLEYDSDTESESPLLKLIGMVHGSPRGDETATYCTQITPNMKALGDEYTFCPNQ
ncbi:uncharacterized protein LOC128203506 [Mya arenaria]|uniref:uncharacterized protein LOC128203506 n=1 Tax=Mya arenaria TaxID=6604 RepID=UPI0022DF5094|nr:uncharacterized protein LOC128203506 [Mya arenaria]